MNNKLLKTITVLLIISFFIGFIFMISCIPTDPTDSGDSGDGGDSGDSGDSGDGGDGGDGGDSGDGGDPGPYIISGYITESGTGSADYGVTLKGDIVYEMMVTDTNGYYSFTVDPGLYTIVPSRPGYSFDSPSIEVTIVDMDSTGNDFTAADLGTSYTYIHDIQGTNHSSSMDGGNVTGVYGIVTVVVPDKGFYLQTPDNQIDTDLKTSEGIYIYQGIQPTVSEGDEVTLDAVVDEFGYTGWLPLTELNTITNLQTLNTGVTLPATITLGNGGRIPPVETIYSGSGASADISNDPIGDPETEGIAFYESLEGMLVTVNDAEVLGTSHTVFDEFYVVADSAVNSNSVTDRGGLYISENDFNPERVLIDYGESSGTIYDQGQEYDIALGAVFDAPINGVIGYSDSFITPSLKAGGKYKVFPIEALPSYTENTLPRETTAVTSSADVLTVASLNVENFPVSDDDWGSTEIQAKIDEIADTIVNGLNSPDIIGIAEMEDDSGPTNDGTVSATQNYLDLIDAIEEIDSGLIGVYDFTEIAPVDGQDGGWPGANIRVGFMYRIDRVSFVEVPGADATTANAVIDNGGTPDLQYNPGRIEPTDTAWNSSRKPLAAKFTFNSNDVFIIMNHFNSKRGDGGLWENLQPPEFDSAVQRSQQATLVNQFVDDILAIDSNANVIVMGDLNDFEFSEPIKILTGEDENNPILYDLATELLPENDRYSYIYNGNSQALDHILISSNILDNATPEADIVHRYSEYLYGVRMSDHDPTIAGLNLTAGDDTTPPVWLSGYPNISDVNPVTPSANLNLKTNETGTAYYEVSTTVDAYTDPATLKSDAINDGTAQALTGGTEATVPLNLTAGQTNYVYVVAEDDEATPNLQTTIWVVTIDLGDSTPPTVTASVANTTHNSTELTIEIDEDGTAYYAVVEDGVDTPPADNNEAKANGTPVSLSAGTPQMVAIDSLNPNTAYSVYVVAEDIMSNLSPLGTPETFTTNSSPGDEAVFISEYIEGSSYNKGLEIYNGTGSTLTLRSGSTHNYFMLIDQRGSSSTGPVDWTSATLVEFDDGSTISDGDVFCITNSSADATMLAEADMQDNTICNFNGNDPVALVKDMNNNGTYEESTDIIIDVIGPDNVTGDFAKDTTLVRKDTITSGSTTWDLADWDSYSQDTFSYFGSHSVRSIPVLSY
jgi:predicted extracellular nuclease